MKTECYVVMSGYGAFMRVVGVYIDEQEALRESKEQLGGFYEYSELYGCDCGMVEALLDLLEMAAVNTGLTREELRRTASNEVYRRKLNTK